MTIFDCNWSIALYFTTNLYDVIFFLIRVTLKLFDNIVKFRPKFYETVKSLGIQIVAETKPHNRTDSRDDQKKCSAATATFSCCQTRNIFYTSSDIASMIQNPENHTPNGLQIVLDKLCPGKVYEVTAARVLEDSSSSEHELFGWSEKLTICSSFPNGKFTMKDVNKGENNIVILLFFWYHSFIL